MLGGFDSSLNLRLYDENEVDKFEVVCTLNANTNIAITVNNNIFHVCIMNFFIV